MALNYIWIAFFLIAFVVALIKLIFFGDTEIFQKILEDTFQQWKAEYKQVDDVLIVGFRAIF